MTNEASGLQPSQQVGRLLANMGVLKFDTVIYKHVRSPWIFTPY